MKTKDEKNEINSKESNVNSVIPTEPLEEHPLFFSAKVNDKYYLSAFGHILTPDGFNSQQELISYLEENISFLIEVALICAFYQLQKSINFKKEE